MGMTGTFRSLHDRDFQVLTRLGLSGPYTTGTFRKESREFEGGGFGWISGGRKDQGFEWGKIRGGGEQLF